MYIRMYVLQNTIFQTPSWKFKFISRIVHNEYHHQLRQLTLWGLVVHIGFSKLSHPWFRKTVIWKHGLMLIGTSITNNVIWINIAIFLSGCISKRCLHNGSHFLKDPHNVLICIDVLASQETTLHSCNRWNKMEFTYELGYCSLFWWLRARLQYLHCISNGDTAVLH